ncbi:MAG: BrnT family toxin [Acidobacteriaceae bacterium]
MKFDWQVQKAEANYKKHGVRFPESLPVFEDDFSITITDDESDPGEQRFISIGMGVRGRVLVVIYTYREASIRIISARPAEPQEIRQYEENR